MYSVAVQNVEQLQEGTSLTGKFYTYFPTDPHDFFQSIGRNVIL